VEFRGNRRALRTLYDCSVPGATSIKGAAKLMSFRHNLRDICMKYYGYLAPTIVGFLPVSLASLVFVMLLATKKLPNSVSFQDGHICLSHVVVIVRTLRNLI